MLHGIERTNRQEEFLVNEKSLLLIFYAFVSAEELPRQILVKE